MSCIVYGSTIIVLIIVGLYIVILIYNRYSFNLKYYNLVAKIVKFHLELFFSYTF